MNRGREKFNSFPPPPASLCLPPFLPSFLPSFLSPDLVGLEEEEEEEEQKGRRLKERNEEDKEEKTIKPDYFC